MHHVNAPALAGEFHRNFTRGANYLSNNKKSFSVSDEAENKLRIALLESGWMMQGITMMDMVEETGQAITIGDSSLHTGRALEGRFNKPLAVNGTPYVLVETDSCASLSYAQMSLIANVGGIDHFTRTVAAFFERAMALDILRIGLNGAFLSPETNPTKYPKGEDINLGWHAVAKQFNGGSQVLADAITLGNGGDFPHLDALANHLITQKIPEGLREDPRLVVLVGAELAAAERLRLFNMADRPADLAAAQMVTSSIAGRFAFVPPFMPGKRLAITTLENLHVYTQKHSRYFRAEFVDDRSVYEHSYWRNEGYALGDGYLYAAADEQAITLLP
ncbi:P2 family phage major capsid protein [Pectobacterium carotovorum]|uniref:Major capsid protein n=1 Tax=Pectobacterium carotovorum TaxID=554 RepID=A0A419AZ22_PECCA|nr:P2 family phage major capsid protein [Pectobacterium carotovorum]RJL53697.1 major capsid protein [Pectobacterium carotovorum]